MNEQHTLIWIDLEMTGLNLEHDVILEIASIITDNNLAIVAEGPSFVIHYDDEVLAGMNDWCKAQHKASGLTEAVQKSTTMLDVAEQKTLEFITHYCPPEKGILCGNSVWQDRNFLYRYMPHIMRYLSYKLIDVTSIQQLVKRWYPKNPALEFKKKDAHRALPDIRESIEELKHYRDNFFLKL